MTNKINQQRWNALLLTIFVVGSLIAVAALYIQLDNYYVYRKESVELNIALEEAELHSVQLEDENAQLQLEINMSRDLHDQLIPRIEEYNALLNILRPAAYEDK